MIGHVDSRYGGGPGLNSSVHSMDGPKCSLASEAERCKPVGGAVLCAVAPPTRNMIMNIATDERVPANASRPEPCGGGVYVSERACCVMREGMAVMLGSADSPRVARQHLDWICRILFLQHIFLQENTEGDSIFFCGTQMFVCTPRVLHSDLLVLGS